MNAQSQAQPRAANTFLKKISPKTVTDAIGIDLLNLPRPVQPRHLYDQFGTVRDATMVPDRSGQGRKESIRFRGRFQAVTEDGMEFDSAASFIPGGLDEVIYEAFKAAREANPDAVIELALSISIKPAPSGKPSATGYEFDVQRISAPSVQNPDDPIARLRREAAAVRQARLGAPATPVAGASTAANGASSVHGAVSGESLEGASSAAQDASSGKDEAVAADVHTRGGAKRPGRSG